MTAGRPTTAPTRSGTTQTFPYMSIRSTDMSQLLSEDLARAHLNQRLANAERARLAAHVVRVAKARRHSQKAVRAAERAQLRLRLLVS